MEDWDEAKLEEVVNKKHGEKNKQMPTTSIVSAEYYGRVLHPFNSDCDLVKPYDGWDLGQHLFR